LIGDFVKLTEAPLSLNHVVSGRLSLKLAAGFW